jgi:hypothetical protein
MKPYKSLFEKRNFKEDFFLKKFENSDFYAYPGVERLGSATPKIGMINKVDNKGSADVVIDKQYVRLFFEDGSIYSLRIPFYDGIFLVEKNFQPIMTLNELVALGFDRE